MAMRDRERERERERERQTKERHVVINCKRGKKK